MRRDRDHPCLQIQQGLKVGVFIDDQNAAGVIDMHSQNPSPESAFSETSIRISDDVCETFP